MDLVAVPCDADRAQAERLEAAPNRPCQSRATRDRTTAPVGPETTKLIRRPGTRLARVMRGRLRPGARSDLSLAMLSDREDGHETRETITAGLVGGVAMTALGWLVRQVGLEMNAEMMLGTMVSTPGVTAWMIGLLMHLTISALIALAYAWGFEHVTHRAGAAVGLGFAVIHIVIAGVVMAMIPAMHPMIPEQMPAPGRSWPAWVPRSSAFS